MPTPYKEKSAYMDDLSLRSLRTRYKLSQSDLAARLGVSRYLIASWEASPGFMPKLVELAVETVKRQLNDEFMATKNEN